MRCVAFQLMMTESIHMPCNLRSSLMLTHRLTSLSVTGIMKGPIGI